VLILLNKYFLKGIATTKKTKEIADNTKYLVDTPHQKRSINPVKT
jgi:hypothetical protein